MKRKTLWLILICLMVFAVVLASCGPAAVEEEEGKVITGEVEEKKEVVTEKKVEEEDVASKEEGPQYGGTLIFGIASLVGKYWDPFYYPYAMELVQCSLEKLGQQDWTVPRDEYDFTTTWLPPKFATGCLAESWEFPDPLSTVFHIRKGVHFQDKPPVNGREMTAYDVEYTFHRILGLGSGFTERSPYIGQAWAGWITSVEATDKYTVVLTTEEPRGMLIEYLTCSATNDSIIAREVVEQTEDGYSDWRNLIGTGPFILTDYVDGSSGTFIRHPNYWENDPLHPENRMPYADTLKVMLIPDAATRLAALRAGKIDQLSGISYLDLQSLQQTTPRLLSREYLGGCSAISVRTDIPPFNDVNVRYAAQLALNQEEIARDYYQGAAELYYGTWVTPLFKDIAPRLEDYPEDIQEMFGYNPEKAKQLLADAGHPNGFKTDLWTCNQRWSEDLPELIASYLSEIDIEVEIKTLDYATFWNFTFGKSHETMNMFWGAMSCHPAEAINYGYTGVPWNTGNISDPFFDQTFDEGRLAFDPDERARLFKEAEIYATSQRYFLTLPVQKSWVVWQPWLGGYQGELMSGPWHYGVVWKHIWVDQELKMNMGY